MQRLIRQRAEDETNWRTQAALFLLHTTLPYYYVLVVAFIVSVVSISINDNKYVRNYSVGIALFQ